MKGQTKAEKISCTISAESIYIPVEFNWIQTLFRMKRVKDGTGEEALSWLEEMT